MATKESPVATISSPPSSPLPARVTETLFRILLTISFCHLLNDTVQTTIMAYYPVLKSSFHLSFARVGLITLTYQLTASILQPIIGMYTDRRPRPFSLSAGMAVTTMGLISWSMARDFYMLLFSATLVGVGSAIFHPEASRIARMASGGQHGLAQSIFQVGGNAGASIGPLLAAFIVVPLGQYSLRYFSLLSLLALLLLAGVGAWYKRRGPLKPKATAVRAQGTDQVLSRSKVAFAITVLVVLIFSKFAYLSSLNGYFTFYLMGKFHLSVQAAQIHLFLFLGAVAVGTFAGGPIGDRIGRKLVIWCSILGVLPFTLAMPYANLFWTTVLTIITGLVLASAFSAIVVFAQELVPGRIGMISGLFFGFSFGIGGACAAVLGKVADVRGIVYVYHVCSFLPLIGLLTAFLPNIEPARRRQTEPARPLAVECESSSD
jgi:FSR family fosmidomycin resistance protein-like MFS transporter